MPVHRQKKDTTPDTPGSTQEQTAPPLPDPALNLPARSDFYAALGLPCKSPGTATIAGKGNCGGKNHATDVTDPDLAGNVRQRGPGPDQLQGAAGLSHSGFFLVFGDASVLFLHDQLTSPVTSPGK